MDNLYEQLVGGLGFPAETQFCGNCGENSAVYTLDHVPAVVVAFHSIGLGEISTCVELALHATDALHGEGHQPVLFVLALANPEVKMGAFPPNTLTGLRMAFGMIVDYLASGDLRPQLGIVGANTFFEMLSDAANATVVKRTQSGVTVTPVFAKSWGELLKTLS